MKIDKFKIFEYKIDNNNTIIKILINDHWNSFEYIENILEDLGYEKDDIRSKGDKYIIINKISNENKLYYFRDFIYGYDYYKLPDDLDSIINKIKKIEKIKL